MSRLGILIAFLPLSLIACRGRTDDRGPVVTRDMTRARDTTRVRAVLRGPPPTQVALSDFRPHMPIAVDTGGRCREDPYRTGQGLRGVVWRTDGEDRHFWEIRVAIDSGGAVRHYLEDRYGSSAGRTMIQIDFDAGRGRVENSIPQQPAQKVVDEAGAVFRAPNLDDPSRQAARVLERCRSSLDPWGTLASLPDSLAPPPVPRPPPRAADINREWRDSTRGVGYLTSTANLAAFDWFRLAIMPLYKQPGDARPFAWLARGWIYRVGAPGRWDPWRVAGWISTVYDGPVSLIVFDVRPDAWFSLRYAAATPADGGIAWVHQSHLTLGAVDLKVVTWEHHYLHRLDGTPTYIMDSTPQPLREAPDGTSRVIASLEQDQYGFFPLEIQGDWMKVRVQWPGPWCGTAAQRTAEGWIVWRTPNRGPRLGIYTVC